MVRKNIFACNFTPVHIPPLNVKKVCGDDRDGVREAYYAHSLIPLDFCAVADSTTATTPIRVTYLDPNQEISTDIFRGKWTNVSEISEEEISRVFNRYVISGSWSSDYFNVGDVRPMALDHIPKYETKLSDTEIVFECSYCDGGNNNNYEIRVLFAEEYPFEDRCIDLFDLRMSLCGSNQRFISHLRNWGDREYKFSTDDDNLFFEQNIIRKMLPTVHHLFKCWLDMLFGIVTTDFVFYAKFPSLRGPLNLLKKIRCFGVDTTHSGDDCEETIPPDPITSVESEEIQNEERVQSVSPFWSDWCQKIVGCEKTTTTTEMLELLYPGFMYVYKLSKPVSYHYDFETERDLCLLDVWNRDELIRELPFLPADSIPAVPNIWHPLSNVIRSMGGFLDKAAVFFESSASSSSIPKKHEEITAVTLWGKSLEAYVTAVAVSKVSPVINLSHSEWISEEYRGAVRLEPGAIPSVDDVNNAIQCQRNFL